MTLIEINYKPTLKDKKHWQKKRIYKYEFVDCTRAVQSLEIEGDTEWPLFMQRLMAKAEILNPDVVASPVDFADYELELILGKKGVFVNLADGRTN